MRIRVVRLDAGLPLPQRAHPLDAGLDLMTTTDLTLPPGGRVLVGTGLAIDIPAGFAGFVHPRSGLAARHGLTVVNAPGTIDAGYRGEVKVCLLNTDATQPLSLRRGDRIAQLVVQAVELPELVEVTNLDDTERGAGGHGSTGGVGVWTWPGGDAPGAL